MKADYVDDELKVSKWNPADLKMKRLDEANILINNSKLNPKAWNMDCSEYNYILWLRGINILFGEIDSKLTQPEKDELNRLKSAIEKAQAKYPVQELKIRELGNPKIEWNENRWVIFKKYLEQYENLVRKFSDEHGYDTPLKDESDLF